MLVAAAEAVRFQPTRGLSVVWASLVRCSGSASRSSCVTFFSPKPWGRLTRTCFPSILDTSPPADAQAAAYRALHSEAPHVAIADHAGSGKTLAYLAPLVQALRAHEAAAGKPVTRPNCPRLVIITPTEGDIDRRLCWRAASVSAPSKLAELPSRQSLTALTNVCCRRAVPAGARCGAGAGKGRAAAQRRADRRPALENAAGDVGPGAFPLSMSSSSLWVHTLCACSNEFLTACVSSVCPPASADALSDWPKAPMLQGTKPPHIR